MAYHNTTDEDQLLLGVDQTPPNHYSLSYATTGDEPEHEGWEDLRPHNNHKDGKQTAITRGHMLLLFVAVLYGTLNVSVRAVYDLPDPPSASALSTVRGWLGVLCFAPLLWCQQTPTTIHDNHDDASLSTEGQDTAGRPTTTTHRLLQPDLWKVAAELAVWNFGAQALSNVGLVYVLAARAAFFTQLSVVMTPALSALSGHKVHANVWWACGIALGGLILLSEKASPGGDDETGNTSSSGLDLTLSFGDVLCLCGALSWSTYIFRVSAVGDAYDEVHLQAVKNVILASLYTLWFLLEMLITGERQWLGCTSLAAWALLFYSALGPGTIADVAQQKAQSTVVATVANIILSSEPVVTAILARFLLGELTTWPEKVGGCLILVAAAVATRE